MKQLRAFLVGFLTPIFLLCWVAFKNPQLFSFGNIETVLTVTFVVVFASALGVIAASFSRKLPAPITPLIPVVGLILYNLILIDGSYYVNWANLSLTLNPNAFWLPQILVDFAIDGVIAYALLTATFTPTAFNYVRSWLIQRKLKMAQTRLNLFFMLGVLKQ